MSVGLPSLPVRNRRRRTAQPTMPAFLRHFVESGIPAQILAFSVIPLNYPTHFPGFMPAISNFGTGYWSLGFGLNAFLDKPVPGCVITTTMCVVWGITNGRWKKSIIPALERYKEGPKGGKGMPEIGIKGPGRLGWAAAVAGVNWAFGGLHFWYLVDVFRCGRLSQYDLKKTVPVLDGRYGQSTKGIMEGR